MSGGPPTTHAERRRRRRTLLIASVGALTVLAAVLVAGPATPTGPAYDPASATSDGLLGLVELLRGADVDVEVAAGPPDDVSTRLFIASDLLTSQGREDIAAWVEDGGTLVVGDPSSPLIGLEVIGRPLEDLAGATARGPGCDQPALVAVGSVVHGDWASYGGSDDVPAADADADEVARCFLVGDDGAWLTVQRRGAGTLVAIGSPAPLTNSLLARDDNAVLAAALLGPGPGDRLRILARPVVGEGETPLLQLVPDGTWPAVAVLLVALLVLVAARGRRLGPPVAERLPPVLPSAELARSLGGLLQRTGDRELAAVRLRQGAHEDVARALGRPTTIDPETLAGSLAARTGLPVAVARRALLASPVTSDEELIEIAEATIQARAAAARGGLAPASAADA
jgi:hypothetical protein